MRFDNWNTGRKLNLAFGSIVFSLACVTAVVLVCLAQIRKASTWDAHTAEVLGQIATASKAMVDQETGVRGYLLSGGVTFLEPYNSGASAFEGAVASLARLTADNPAQQARIQNLREVAGGWRQEVAEREISLRRDPATAERGIALETSGAGKTRMDAARKALAAMSDAETTLQKVRAQATARAHASATLALVTGAMIAGALAVFMSWLIARRVIAPLTGVTEAMRQIVGGARDVQIPARGRTDEIGSLSDAAAAFTAATETLRQENEASVQRDELDRERAERELAQARADREQREVIEAISAAIMKLADGDLTHRIQHPLPGDAEHMREAFNQALDQLEQALLAVTASTIQINSSSSELYRGAQDLSRRTEQQAASLEESAAALDQITATVRRTAEGAQEASTVVASAREAADTSGAVMIEAVEAMTSIETSASQIAQIIGVIDEIAFQTNLLALNAGVEAARAGEAGRGFAVVASEVRALAQRSAEAAKEIKSLINTSTGEVGRGVELVARTGDALKEIIGKFTEISGLTRDIANSAQEQATGLGQVNTTVNHMDQMTQQNAAMVNETTSASEALAEAAQELNRLVARFKTRPAADSAAPPAKAVGARPPSRRARIARGGSAAVALAEAPADDWTEF